MKADKWFFYIVGFMAIVWVCIVFFPTVRAEGFQPQYVPPVQIQTYDQYYQQPRQRERRTERQVQRNEEYRNEQQPIVGGQNGGYVWDTNPKQINGGQGNGSR